MTKQEIKDLVSAKLAGQGNQVDLGSALPKILDEVIDLIPEGGGGSQALPVYNVSVSESDFVEGGACILIGNEGNSWINVYVNSIPHDVDSVIVNITTNECETVVLIATCGVEGMVTFSVNNAGTFQLDGEDDSKQALYKFNKEGDTFVTIH